MTDIVAIMAHPDDAELLCGGLLIRSADLGHRTGIIDLTGGERGSAGSAGLREREATEAGRILGLDARVHAGLPDGELENSPAARLVVAGLIRELRPRVVILHWPIGRHPDHRAASELGRDACFIAGLSHAPVDHSPHRPSKVIYCASYREEPVQPSFVVDITDQIDRKIDAIRAYGSQFDGKAGVGDIFGGGDRELYDQVRVHAAHYGSLIRRPYGEPYWMRETMRIDDVLDLNVSTF